MPVIGIPAFNAVAILKIDPVVFTNKDVSLVAHGAFVNTESGNTYGHTTCRRWSKRTIETLLELRRLMEEDLADMVFQRVASGTTQPQEQDPGGIGETLRGGGDVPTDAAQV